MSLAELYSAMVEQVSDRLGADRHRGFDRRFGSVQQPQPVLVQDAQRIRNLELENTEIKARFTAIVNLLLKKGLIHRSDLDGWTTTQVQDAPAPAERDIQPAARPVNALPAPANTPGKRGKRRRR